MQVKQQSALKAFLLQNQSQLSFQVRKTSIESIKANILTLQQVAEAATQIKNGKLVAFPTQTVYGLGANAYDQEALKSIYNTKKRPLTDPIIVHVLNAEQGSKLVFMNKNQQKMFDILTKQYWPGPLTVILKANLQILPMIVTAQTGFVGIRAPRNQFARKLIQQSGLPIGAPSANLFSHVSPTEPVHVFNDFFNCDISIVNGKRCEYGVESTVIKLSDNKLHVLRQGSLSIKNLQKFLKITLSDSELPEVIVHKKVENKNTNMEAPGQLLKHYAPYLPCYLLHNSVISESYQCQSNKHNLKLNQLAFISFSNQFDYFEKQVKYFFKIGKNLTNAEDEFEQDDIFCSKQQKQKMRQIYYLLRKCENLQVQAIVIGWNSPQEGTLWDKIYRSTQGQQLTIL